MTDIADNRTNIQEEEMSNGAGVSESTLFRVGAAINFINNKQFDTFEFKLNGPYFIAGVLDGADGLLPIPFNCRIVGAAMYNITKGTSGQTTLDVRRFTAPNVDAGSIFSTKPTIKFGSPNNSYVQNILGTIYHANTDRIAPVLAGVNNYFDLNAGDALRIDLDESMTKGETCGLILYYIPR